MYIERKHQSKYNSINFLFLLHFPEIIQKEIMVNLSESTNQVAFNIFNEEIGPLRLVTYKEYKQVVNTTCRGTRWDTKEKNGTYLKQRLLCAIRPYRRKGSQYLRRCFRSQLLHFDMEFKLVTNRQKHYKKNDLYYALTPSPLRLEDGNIVLDNERLIMEDGTSFDYQRSFKRDGMSLYNLSGSAETSNDGEAEAEFADDNDDVENDGHAEVSTSLPISAANIKAAVQQSVGNYRSSEQDYQRAQQLVDYAKGILADEEDPDNVLGHFQTLQRYRANAVKARKEMDEYYVVLHTMIEAINDCNNLIDRL